MFDHISTSSMKVFLNHIQSKCGKIRTRKTPHLDPFHAVKERALVAITKLSNNKIRETICKWLKCMCKFFEINRQEDFSKLVIFSIASKYFIIDLPQGNSHYFTVAYHYCNRELCTFFPLSYRKSKLSVKLRKSLCKDIWLCRSLRGLYFSNLWHYRN